MGLSVKLIQITQETSVNHSKAYTGVGFQPKVAIGWFNDRTADGNGSVLRYGFGVACSSSDRRSMAAYQPDNDAGTGFPSSLKTNRFLHAIQINSSAIVEIDLVSFDSDGLTLDYSVVDGTARLINILLIGGTDLTNVETGQFTKTTTAATVDQDISTSFTPDCLIPFDIMATTTAPSTNAQYQGAYPQIGWCGGGGSGDVSGVFYRSDGGYGKSGQASSDGSYAGITELINNTGTRVNRAKFKAFGTNKCTITWTVNDATARYIFYLAMKGAQFKAKTITLPTSVDSNAPFTGAGFQPSAVIFGNTKISADPAITGGGMYHNWGVGVSSSNQFYVGLMSRNTGSGNNSDCGESLASDHCMAVNTWSSSLTNNATAKIVTLDSDGMTLNVDVASATAYIVNVLYIGAAASAETITPDKWYRQTSLPKFEPTEVVSY